MKFQTNKKYYARSICDSNCIWNFTVIKRSKSTITIYDKMEKREKRCKIHNTSDGEFVYPLGRYSMSPILRAEKEII